MKNPTGYIKENCNFIGNDGLLYNIYVGSQTVKSLQLVYKELLALTSELRKNKKRILVLTDIINLGSIGLHARTYAVDIIKNIDFDKVAIFGNYIVTERVVNFIIIASGRGYKMKYFSNKNEAKEWLVQQ